MFESFDNKFTTTEELKKWQEETLIDFVNYALKNCPFYKNKGYPSEIKNLDDFRALPYLSGDDLRDNNYDFLTNKEELWRVFASSGTTGKPKLSFYGRDLLESYVIGVGDMIQRAGIDLSDKNNVGCVMFPMGGLTGSGPATAGGLEGLKIPTLTLGIDINPAFAVNIMEKMKPNFIFMYPSSFNIFSNEIEKAGINPKGLKIKSIISAGEPLTDNIRAEIKEKWGAEVFNMIGSVDISNFTGSECSIQDGFHVFSRNVYVEILDENDNNIEQGEGEVVLTSLVNKTMPLIRYRSKDIFEYKTDICKCGLMSPRFWFRRRKDDMIILTGGAKIFPQDISYILQKFPELTSDYQIVIDSVNGKDTLLFTIESKDISDELRIKIVESLLNISSLARKIEDKTALPPKVKLVKINTLERQRGKLKNRVLEKRIK